MDSCDALTVSVQQSPFRLLLIGNGVFGMGGWSDEAVDMISSIGRLIGQHLGISPMESTHHLLQRCAISLQRGNAALWIHQCPIRAPSVDGVL